jgi:hypothetical protein
MDEALVGDAVDFIERVVENMHQELWRLKQNPPARSTLLPTGF